MKIRHPLIQKSLGLLSAFSIRLWMRTVRRHLLFADGQMHPIHPRKGPIIYAFWHESIFFSTIFRSRVNVLISQHRDGEFIAQTCRHLGYGTIRGSTTRQGISAMLKMIKAVRSAHLVITPDGPRGPRREFQAGAIFIASKTGIPILPLGVGYHSAWRAKSWDRFAIPLPFTTAFGVGGDLIHIPPKLDSEGIEAYRMMVQTRMLACTQAAEDWADGKGRPDFARLRAVAEEPARKKLAS